MPLLKILFSFKNLPFLAVLLIWSCSQRNYNVEMKPQPVATVPVAPVSPDSTMRSTPQDSVNRPSLETAPPAAATEGAKAAVKEEKKTKKKKKNVFLGYKTRKGVVRIGKGKNAVIETFSYLREYKEPSAYAPAKYYYHIRRKRIFKGRTIDPKVARIVHGPYKKMQGKIVLEEGYFYIGTKHLRWEKYNKAGILIGKTHYEQGYPRDAQITYYDGARQKVKEVIPYLNGKVEGDYVKFRPDGLLEWEGQYENGRKVGEWIEYWPFRNRRRYVYKYAESGFDEPIEPYLFREYNRNNVLIYEKDKLDKRAEQR